MHRKQHGPNSEIITGVISTLEYIEPMFVSAHYIQSIQFDDLLAMTLGDILYHPKYMEVSWPNPNLAHIMPFNLAELFYANREGLGGIDVASIRDVDMLSLGKDTNIPRPYLIIEQKVVDVDVVGDITDLRSGYDNPSMFTNS